MEHESSTNSISNLIEFRHNACFYHSVLRFLYALNEPAAIVMLRPLIQGHIRIINLFILKQYRHVHSMLFLSMDLLHIAFHSMKTHVTCLLSQKKLFISKEFNVTAKVTVFMHSVSNVHYSTWSGEKTLPMQIFLSPFDSRQC